MGDLKRTAAPLRKMKRCFAICWSLTRRRIFHSAGSRAIRRANALQRGCRPPGRGLRPGPANKERVKFRRTDATGPAYSQVTPELSQGESVQEVLGSSKRACLGSLSCLDRTEFKLSRLVSCWLISCSASE